MKLLLPRLCKQLFQQKYSLFLISSFVCMFSASAQQINSEGYQLSHISPEPYIQDIKRSGKVGFKRMVNLSFKTAGFLTKLNVDEGDIFKQKQLIVFPN